VIKPDSVPPKFKKVYGDLLVTRNVLYETNKKMSETHNISIIRAGIISRLNNSSRSKDYDSNYLTSILLIDNIAKFQKGFHIQIGPILSCFVLLFEILFQIEKIKITPIISTLLLYDNYFQIKLKLLSLIP